MENYKKALADFQAFLNQTFHISWKKAHIKHFIAYTAFLHHHNHNSAGSIKTKLSGIAHFYKTRFGTNPVKSDAVDKMLQNYSRKQSLDSRKPLKAYTLQKLLKSYNASPHTYYKHVFYILYVMMYRMALRVSEVANYSQRFSHAIELNDVRLIPTTHQLKVNLKTYKHSRQNKLYNITVTSQFIQHWESYIKARKSSHAQLFVHKDGTPFTRNFIANRLKKDLISIGINPKNYNTHSIRIGRASDLAEKGCADTKIAEIGRWRSNAFNKYIRNPVTQA